MSEALSKKQIDLLAEYGFTYPWSPRNALKLVHTIEDLREEVNDLKDKLSRIIVTGGQ